MSKLINSLQFWFTIHVYFSVCLSDQFFFLVNRSEHQLAMNSIYLRKENINTHTHKYIIKMFALSLNISTLQTLM